MSDHDPTDLRDFDARIFNRAADLVDKGWTQGQSAIGQYVPVSFDSPVAICFCAVGAVARALLDAGWWCKETMSVAIVAMTRHVGGSPQKWNDAPERTKDEVVTMLRSLAAVSA